MAAESSEEFAATNVRADEHVIPKRPKPPIKLHALKHHTNCALRQGKCQMQQDWHAVNSTCLLISLFYADKPTDGRTDMIQTRRGHFYNFPLPMPQQATTGSVVFQQPTADTAHSYHHGQDRPNRQLSVGWVWTVAGDWFVWNRHFVRPIGEMAVDSRREQDCGKLNCHELWWKHRAVHGWHMYFYMYFFIYLPIIAAASRTLLLDLTSGSRIVTAVCVGIDGCR